MECATTNSKNYSKSDDEDAVLHPEQTISGELKLEYYRPIKELARIKLDRDQTLKAAHFSSAPEKETAENLQLQGEKADCNQRNHCQSFSNQWQSEQSEIQPFPPWK